MQDITFNNKKGKGLYENYHLYLLLSNNVTDPKQNEFLKELKLAQRHKKIDGSVAIKKIYLCWKN
jgi:hypothetical protein